MGAWTPDSAFPQPPINVFVVSPFKKDILDIRWDDPGLLGSNSAWSVLGVNIYRSDASDRGPYRRLNATPIGGTFFRDFTDIGLVNKEVVLWDGGWVSKGDTPNIPKWIIKTRNPIYKQFPGSYLPNTSGPVYANAPGDVVVKINGVPARIYSVFGATGEITLVTSVPVDPRDDRYSPSPLPTGPSDEVIVTYYTVRNVVSPGVDKKSFYRVTTVASDTSQIGGLIETPLNITAPASDMQIERVDYIWREAIRRNMWMLEQGGERVKLFVQRVSGVICMCRQYTDPESRVFLKQASNMCQICYGTGFVHGYEGPYDIILSPDDSERRIAQSNRGRNKSHVEEVWMSFSPIISQRDFIVKQNNDRYSVGPVRRPSSRGNVMQQHFSISYLDSTDIRYYVPIDPAIVSPNLLWPQTRYTYDPLRETYDQRTDAPWPVTPDAAIPMATDKTGLTNVSESQQIRSRTGAGSNENY